MNALLLADHDVVIGKEFSDAFSIALVALFFLAMFAFLAIFAWAIIRLIQVRDPEIAGLPWVAWLVIVLFTGFVGSVVFIAVSYSHEKTKREAREHGLYYDGRAFVPAPGTPVYPPAAGAPVAPAETANSEKKD